MSNLLVLLANGAFVAMIDALLWYYVLALVLLGLLALLVAVVCLRFVVAAVQRLRFWSADF